MRQLRLTENYKIALITMDSVDQHWVSLKEGAEEEAKADGVTVDFMAPDVKDDANRSNVSTMQ